MVIGRWQQPTSRASVSMVGSHVARKKRPEGPPGVKPMGSASSTLADELNPGIRRRMRSPRCRRPLAESARSTALRCPACGVRKVREEKKRPTGGEKATVSGAGMGASVELVQSVRRGSASLRPVSGRRRPSELASVRFTSAPGAKPAVARSVKTTAPPLPSGWLMRPPKAEALAPDSQSDEALPSGRERLARRPVKERKKAVPGRMAVL